MRPYWVNDEKTDTTLVVVVTLMRSEPRTDHLIWPTASLSYPGYSKRRTNWIVCVQRLSMFPYVSYHGLDMLLSSDLTTVEPQICFQDSDTWGSISNTGRKEEGFFAESVVP
ncbi:hypothetical protein Bca4012_029475 [Brassica carinata]|uniref:(rape) hypothetical protein n=1 Tax=Brassica napus TaxID=3708 RepID=A0A816JC79_BRANA|nr:unnamed protein product [Brassica napus]